MNLAFAKTDYGDWELGSYGDYLTWPFQFIGVAEVFFVASIVLLGIVKADLFEGLVQTEGKAEDKDRYQEMSPL